MEVIKNTTILLTFNQKTAESSINAGFFSGFVMVSLLCTQLPAHRAITCLSLTYLRFPSCAVICILTAKFVACISCYVGCLQDGEEMQVV